ncbi:MAG TPA: efflux RND transporter periplasmic adaptor subunit [Nannocystaceae bacterium]|nr:efflux RND transporter periplasmic adaptor subunit [Nannocystaceae bacterium]
MEVPAPLEPNEPHGPSGLGMAPTAPERRSGPRLLASLLFFAALAGAGWYAMRPAVKDVGGNERRGPDGALAVRIVEVRSEPYAPTITATGTLRANESVELVSELTRRLVRIHADEGAHVEKGQVLFELDDDDLLARRGRLRSARGLAARTLERDDELVRTGIQSAEALDQSRTRVDDARAQADENEVALAKTRIRAPFTGTLGIRHVSEGAWVGPTVPLASLYDTTRLKLDFRVPERWAGTIAVGREFSFRVPGSPTVHKGEIAVVEPRNEPATRSLLERGVVDETEGLRPGQFATVSIQSAPVDAMFVPAFAVVPSERGHNVYVERDGVAHEVIIQLGQRTPERVEVLSGLQIGDRVIVTNLLRLREGAEVEPEPYVTVASASQPGDHQGAAP